MFRTLFYEHNILRPSCYECPYKSLHHPGDITIGDFWGIDKMIDNFNDNNGVSMVMLNNKHGENFFFKSIKNIDYEETDINEELQPPLRESFKSPDSRGKFWEDYQKKSFNVIVNRYGGLGLKYRFNYLKYTIKRFFYKLYKFISSLY